MRNQFCRNFLMAVVMFVGLLTSAFVGSDKVTIVNAETTAVAEETIATELPVVDVRSTSAYVSESTIRMFEDRNNEGSETIGESMTKYLYYIHTSSVEKIDVTRPELALSGTKVSVVDGQELHWSVEVKTGTRTWSWSTFSYSDWVWSAQTLVNEGDFKVRLYSHLNLNVDTSAIDNAELPVVSTQETLTSVDSDTYKVYYNDSVTINFDSVPDYYVTINDNPVDGNSYTLNNVTEDVDVNIKYLKSTDNKIIVDEDTINAISNKAITLSINGTTINSKNSTIRIAENTNIEIVAVPSNKHLISTISCNNSVVENEAEYPNYSVSFVGGTSEEYSIAIDVVEAHNTISCNRDNGEVKVSGEWMPQSLNSTLPRDTEVTVVLQPADGEYIGYFNITNINDESVVYNDGDVEITFTTGTNTNYVVEFTTQTMFVAKDNDVEINVYDAILMHEGNELYKQVTYNTIFDNVYTNNTDLTVSDIRLEYLAGTYPLTEDINVEFYFPIEKTSAATHAELKEYVKERWGYIVSLIVTEDVAKDILPRLHRFATQEDEVVKLIYDGNDKYQEIEVLGNIKAVDQREVVTLDINEEISVVYGSYISDSYIMDMILADRNGVVDATGAVMPNLIGELSITESLVGKDVGTHTITIDFNASNYFYKADSRGVTVVISKADVDVEINSGVINYELVINGTLNKDYMASIRPNVVLENAKVDNVYFVMGLDMVDGELIAKLDLSNMSTSDNALVDGVVNKAIEYALKIADPEGDGLTLVEFVEFMNNLSSQTGNEGVELDASYMEKIKDILTQVSQTIDVRIFIINDGSDITPQKHGAYIVGSVITDTNYNTAFDAGYLVITAEILDVKFVANDIENTLRKFEFDGTSKVMYAEAYDIDNQVASGNMKYYYVGIQTDGKFYANTLAPINAGTYFVLAMFSNAEDGGLPSKVGLGVGAMLIVPSDDAEVVVNNAVHTYNGETFDFASMVTVNKTDASLAYITAGINVNGDFSEDGFSAINGSVNIDFPARFDMFLQEYFPEQYTNGLNVDTFINLLNQSASVLEGYGYTGDYVDNIVEVLGNMPNLITITFNDIAEINPSQIGVYLVGAVVCDPNYLPKANMGILVIEPSVSISNMVWNYDDSNRIITVPALSKIDMTASIVGEATDAVVEYVYFGIGENGQFVKLTNLEDITSGIWVQMAYVNEEISANMNLVMPIARMFVVVPQNVNVEIVDDNNCLLRTYNGNAHDVEAVVSCLNGESANPGMLTITYVGVDSMGNKYYSNNAPINAGLYTVIASYIERNDATISYVGFAFAELLITVADNEVIANDTTVCYDGQEHNIDFIMKDGFDYIVVVENGGKINIVLPSSWNVDFVNNIDFTNIISQLARFVPESYLTKIQEIVDKYNAGDITINGAMPTDKGEYAISIIAINPNYSVAVAQNTLIIKDHNTVYHEGKFATCEEAGYTAYYTCTDCDYNTKEIIGALGHQEVVDYAIDPTCTATGLTEGSHCSRCSVILVAQQVVDIIPHTPGNWTVVDNSTCTAKGLEQRLCVDCQYQIDTREIEMLDHNRVFHEGKSATCEEAGYTAYYTCTDCDYNTKEIIDALDHSEVVDHAVDPTCTATGLTEGSHCSRCTKILVAQEVVDMIDHTRQYHTAKPATCTEEGWNAYYTCVNCTYSTKEIIDALDHNEVVDEAVEATCSTTGLTEGSHCSRCEEVLVAQQIVEKINHTFNDWYVAQTATQNTNGYYERKCNECDHAERQVILAYGDREVGNIEVNTDSTGKVTVDTESISDAVKDAQETDKKEIIISSNNAGTTLTNVEISKSSLQQIVDADSSLTIETSAIHATFDIESLSTIIASSNGEGNIEIDLRFIDKEQLNSEQRDSLEDVKVAGIISAQIVCGDNVISSFGDGKVQVKIPFEIANGKSAEDYKIMYIANDGSIEELSTTYTDGGLVVELEHFSEYVIIDITKDAKATSVGVIIALSILSVLALISVGGTIALARKERKR